MPMHANLIASLPQPLPPGVEAETTPDAITVTFPAMRVSIFDRRVWGWGVIPPLILFVPVATVMAFTHGLHMIPFIGCVLGGYGLLLAMGSRRELNRRLSLPCTIVLRPDRLVIEDPGFDYKVRGGHAYVSRVAEGHMEYARDEVREIYYSSSGVLAALEGCLKIDLTNRGRVEHLTGRPKAELDWTCAWLSGSMRLNETASPATSTPPPATSFVYDGSGPRRS
jgi:hypothetical protein